MAEARSLRCPLCCETFVVCSEQECEAHIASCGAFRAEYGEGADRSGLVSGFSNATLSTSAAPPPVASVSNLELACHAYASLLWPLIPLQRDKTAAEAIDLVAHLAGVLVSAADPSDATASEDFGLEEVMTVALGPFLSQMDGGQAASIQASIPQAIEAVQCAAAGAPSGGASSEAICALLTRALQQRKAEVDAASPARAAAAPSFAVGQRVLIDGLESRPLLNGTCGRVVSYDAAKARYGVELDAASQERILLKPANLALVSS